MTATTTITNANAANHDTNNKAPPSHFICPLTNEVMSRPMFHSETEQNFEHAAIMERIAQRKTSCPLTSWPLTADKLQDNMDLEREIRQWRKQQQAVPQKQRQSSWNKELDKKSKKLADCTSTTNPLIREQLCKTQASQVLSMRNKVLQRRERRLRSVQATFEISLAVLSMDDDEE